MGCGTTEVGSAQADQTPVPVAGSVPTATAGVLEVTRLATPELQALHSTELDGTEPDGTELDGSTGVELLEQDVEVLVQTGTEIVHGQSVTVRVVEADTV